MLPSEPLTYCRLSVEFQWFFTALSVLPCSSLAITAPQRCIVTDNVSQLAGAVRSALPCSSSAVIMMC